MAKRRREPEPDSAVPSTAEYNTVFVDTSLGTHFAMLVSDSDTVLDFKRKLIQEHAKCFPNNGEILIHSLKVKRKGNFYHLPDFMLVCSALHGIKGNWFLSVDASGSLECYANQKSPECGIKDHCAVTSSDTNNILSLTMSLLEGVTEENIVSRITVGQKVEKHSGRTAEFQKNDSLENSLGTRSPAKKKGKMNYPEVVSPSPTLVEQCTEFHASGKETFRPVLTGCKIDASVENPKIMPGFRDEAAEDAVVRSEPFNMECNDVEVASIPVTVKKSELGTLETSTNFHGLDNQKENASLKSTMPETLIIDKPQNQVGQNALSSHLEGDTNTDVPKQKKINKRKKIRLPHDQAIKTNFSASDHCKEDKIFSKNADYPGNVTLSKLYGIAEGGHCDNNSEATCLSNSHLALKVDNLNQYVEIEVEERAFSSTNDVPRFDGKDEETDRPDIDDEQKVLSPNHDHELSQCRNFATADQHENTMDSVPADDLLCANKEMGCGSRSKMKAKKSGGKTSYAADSERSENVMALTPLTLPNLEINTLKHYETVKTDSTLSTAETDLNVESKKDRDLSLNHQSDLNRCKFDDTAKDANSSALLMDANGAVEGIKSNGNNRKKTRSQKAAAIFQDISDVELKTKKAGSTGPHTKTSRSRKKDEKRELSMNHDLEVMLPSYKNTSTCADPVMTPKADSESKLLDTNSVEETEISGTSRKKKVKKFAGSNLGKSGVKQTVWKEMNQPDTIEEQRELSESHDPLPMEFEKLGTSDWHEADGNTKESVQPDIFLCAKGEMKHGFKKKRIAKKPRGKIPDETDCEHSDNGIHLTPVAVPNLELKFLKDHETKTTDSILPTAEANLDAGSKEDRNLLLNHETGMNQPEAGVAIIEPKLPSRSIHASGASEDTHYNHDTKKKKTKKSAGKVLANSDRKNMAQKPTGDDGLRHDFEVILPSPSQASGGMEKKNHSSVGDCLMALPVKEKENQVNNLDSSQAQNRSEIVCIKDRKAKNKTKGQPVASDCLENIAIKDQEVGVEVYSTAEKANIFLDLEQERREVDSQVLPHKSEEKIEEIHRTAANTEVRHVTDKDEGINFKHYFLPGKKQDEVAYVGKVKEASKSSEEMRTVKKGKKPGLPSVRTSTELQNSVKSSENKDGEDKSRARRSTGRKDGELIVSSKVSDNGVIDSSPIDMRGITTRKKHNENTVSSPFMKNKNLPLDKSRTERSGIFSRSGGNKRRQLCLNVYDKAVMKTTEKNSLFAKVGSLFQDNSGESSGDENRTANSDDSTCSPSDSSSQSGCSAGESDLSQASTRNGSNDAQERIISEKNNANLDLSASNEVTLDMILRSSKRFKKAKLIASQNELEQIDSQLEFVPDTQPNE